MARTRAELGAPGLPIFGGYIQLDPNTRLRGVQKLRAFREMALDEPAAVAFLSACRNLLRTDVQVTPGGDTDPDKRAAEFVEQALDDMRDSIGTLLGQQASVLWAGFDLREIVYKRRTAGVSKYPDGRIGWATWALRRQESQERWEYDAKKHRVVAWTQRPAPDFMLRTIPLQRAIHTIADDSDGSPEGISPLRGMYRQWYFCKNVEILMGISLERFGTGIPVFSQAEGNTVQLDQDSAAFGLLEDIAASLRQNEEAYVIEPAGWRFRFEPSPGLDAQAFLAAIQRYRLYMLQSVLADFIMLGTEGGAYALGKDKSELFLMALNGVQNKMLEAINRQAVARLIRYNRDTFGGALTAPPVVTLPAIKRYDLAALGSFLQVINTVGAFHPTPEDEALLRKIADMPDVGMEELEELHATPEPMEPRAPRGPQAIDDDEDDDGEDEPAPGADAMSDEQEVMDEPADADA